MTILTTQDLARALRLSLDLPADEAESRAERVLDIFGFDDRVIDNVLEPAERQMFYELQSSGLLTTRSEETDLWNGQLWRTHYWVVREKRVSDLSRAARAREDAPGAQDADADLYATLPADAWAHR